MAISTIVFFVADQAGMSSQIARPKRKSKMSALSDELELISAMYGSEGDDLTVAEKSDSSTVISVCLRPRSGGDELQRYCEATVEILLLATYPESAAVVRLPRTRGLIDEEEARLLGEAKATAADSVPEPCLFAVLEATVSLLTELNAGGACPICREELFGPPEDDPGGSPRSVFLSPCFHSYHVECLGHWWHAFEKPAAKGGADGSDAPLMSGSSVARAAARAAEAAVADLQAKLVTSEESVQTLTDRLALLQAMTDPPPAPALVRSEKCSLCLTSLIARLPLRLPALSAVPTASPARWMLTPLRSTPLRPPPPTATNPPHDLLPIHRCCAPFFFRGSCPPVAGT